MNPESSALLKTGTLNGSTENHIELMPEPFSFAREDKEATTAIGYEYLIPWAGTAWLSILLYGLLTNEVHFSRLWNS